MPQPIQPLVTFPGVQQVVACTFTLSHGISPGSCTLEILPQQGFEALGGTLQFAFGSTVISFPDCRVVSHSVRLDDQGRVVSLAILDRRWKWAFAGPKGPLKAGYNWRHDDGKVQDWTEREPKKLIEDCLIALGETGFEVVLPGDLAFSRPTVEWEHKEPAMALQELCDELGCRVVLRIDNKVGVYPIGAGAELPIDDDVEDQGVALDPPQVPDSISVVCGPTRYEGIFRLEAIALDIDGTYKTLPEVDYAPAASEDDGGFHASDYVEFTNIDDTPVNGYVPRELAKRTVFKTYRIRVDVRLDNKTPFEIFDYGKVTDLREILPIEDVQVATYVDADGITKSLPAKVWGIWWPGDLRFVNVDSQLVGNYAQGTVYDRPFRINKELGIVEFQDAVVKTEAGDSGGYVLKPAVLGLCCAVSVRPLITRAFVRYTRNKQQAGAKWGTGARLLHHDEIRLGIRYETRANSGKPTGPKIDNRADVDKECDYYIKAAERDYEMTLPTEVVYRGWKAISPDGAIQQVTWILTPEPGDKAGATTRASRNVEHSSFVPSYKERRLIEANYQATVKAQQEEKAKRLQRAGQFGGAKK